VAQNASGVSSILYYLMAYALMSIGSFTVLMVVAKPGDQRHAFDDYTGLGTTHPWLAALMTLFMFALAGFPPTAGFTGKFYIFSAALQSGYYSLALIGCCQCLRSCLKVSRCDVTQTAASNRFWSPTTVAVLAITAFGTLYLGIFPGGVFRLASQSVQYLFQGL
jgi:NADH-quinone oxidoreductase subunit N